MDSQELKDIIQEAVRESIAQGDEVLSRNEMRDLMHDAVIEAMSTLGIDARNPMDVQLDMQYLRVLRLTSDKVKSKVIMTLVGVLIMATLAATWIGFKSFLPPAP